MAGRPPIPVRRSGYGKGARVPGSPMAAPRVKTGAVHLFSVDAPVLGVDSGRYGLPKYFK